MTWHYAILEKDGYYELVEEYDMYDGTSSHTEPLLTGESKEDIHRQLLQMLSDTL